MKRMTVACATLLNLAVLTAAEETMPQHLMPVPVQQVRVEDEFWMPKRQVWREVTIPDCFDKFEKDGAIANFDKVRDGTGAGTHGGPPWYDGLMYEMIRGCADFLAAGRDAALERRIDTYVEHIAAAQARSADGYINTWTQLKEPDHRWGMNDGNDNRQHDVYNAGALIEAGVHYYRATGKPRLLQVATRLANHMCDVIGPPPRANVIPGHSLVEEALVKLHLLYRHDPDLKKTFDVPVDERRYLQLAEFFIDARGNYQGRTGKDKTFGAYGQDHASLADQATIEGHAVRATLFCTGIAACAAVNGPAEYLAAAQRLWRNMVTRRMYLTGGLGVLSGTEAFSKDYHLPNDGYSETCAAIAGGFFHHNMNLLHADARYADELERVLYNGALCGVSLAGNTYSYVNPLQFERGHGRWAWHECPCCPPMFVKIMGAMPAYVFARGDDGIYVNLFVGSKATVQVNGGNVILTQTTRYPWDGAVRIAVDPERPAKFGMYVRIPSWCQGQPSAGGLYSVASRANTGAAVLKINGAAVARPAMVRGYARLFGTWQRGDVVELELAMPAVRVRCRPEVKADQDRVALMRGPIVYCAEPTGAGFRARNVFLPPDAPLAPKHRADLLGGVTVIDAGFQAKFGGAPQLRATELVATPYYAYANRGPSDMRVWVPEKVDLVQAATLASNATPSASHCWKLDSVNAVNGGEAPVSSNDISRPRLSWWDHKGTTEWVQYDFPAAKVSKVGVFWFADRAANGGCDVPQNWRLMCKDGDAWKAVTNPSGYGVEPDKFNEVTFTPVTTTGLRVEVQLKPGWSGGICEWRVE